MSPSTVTELIRAHIRATRPRQHRDVDLSDGSLLVATGILDSVDVFELVAFLEHRFGIEIADEDLEWKNFETVEAISRLGASKMAGAQL